MLPFYKIKVQEGDELGVDFNSFVDVPAHLKGFIAFNNEERYQFNEEKRIVTGVMISAGTPIYRNSRDMGEHYVVFDAKTIDIIRKKFFKEGFVQNVNLDHNMERVTNGATLIDSYIVSNSDPKLPNIPQVFEKQRLQDGSWIASYYVTDNALWQDVKSGKFNGFSVEGWFDKVKVEVKNKNKMSKDRKSIWEMFGLATETENTEEVKTQFAEATTADGVVVMYDGELMEGTVLLVEVDGEQIPAPEGEHQLTLEDGAVKIVTLDATGAVVTIADLEEEMESEETVNTEVNSEAGATPEVVEMKAEIAEAMANVVKDIDARFKAIETENKELKAKLEAVNEGDKFNKAPLKADSKKTTRRDILKR